MKIRIAIVSIMLCFGAGCMMEDSLHSREIEVWSQATIQRQNYCWDVKCVPSIKERRLLKEKFEQCIAEHEKHLQELDQWSTDLDNFWEMLTDEESKVFAKVVAEIDFEKAADPEEYLKCMEALTPVFGPPEKSDKCLQYALLTKQSYDLLKQNDDWKQRGLALVQEIHNNDRKFEECRDCLDSVMRWAEQTRPVRGYSSSYYEGRSPSFNLWEQYMQEQKERDFQHQLDGMRFDMEMQLDTIRRERENQLRNMEIERERQQYWDSYFK